MVCRTTCHHLVMLWPCPVLLGTERFRLEPLTVGHAGEMVEALASSELYRFTGGEPPSPGALHARFERQSRGRSADGRAVWLNWVIRSLDSNTAIGFVQATLAGDRAAPVADVAWLVTPAEQGRGTATESAAAVVAWLPTVGVQTVRAFIHPEHAASEHVAQRLGLVRTSTLVQGEVLWEASALVTDLNGEPVRQPIL
jgi:RimJ/RimL family protein N-acetyltransferase